jgi:hypothetical protein
MQRNISPVVAVILILIVVAAVAFVWMKLTAGEKPTTGMPGPGQMGSRRGGQRQTDTDAAQRGTRGRRGGRQAPGGESPTEAAPGGTQADEEED